MLEEKTVKVCVEVGKTIVVVVLTAVLAVEVTVGASALRLAISRSADAFERLARCLCRRERACSWSTMRVSPRFQWRPGGSGIMVGLKVAQGSGWWGLDGTVQDGVTVSVTMLWVCVHRVWECQMVLVSVVVTSDGTIVM